MVCDEANSISYTAFGLYTIHLPEGAQKPTLQPTLTTGITYTVTWEPYEVTDPLTEMVLPCDGYITISNGKGETRTYGLMLIYDEAEATSQGSTVQGASSQGASSEQAGESGILIEETDESGIPIEQSDLPEPEITDENLDGMGLFEDEGEEEEQLTEDELTLPEEILTEAEMYLEETAGDGSWV